MFISNSMHDANNAMAGARLYQARDVQAQAQRWRTEERGDKQGPAAVFEQSGMEEYLHRMASLQSRVLKLKERLEEVKNDTAMEQEKKDSLLGLLTETLASTQKQVEELKAKKGHKKENAAAAGEMGEGETNLNGGVALIASRSSMERLELLRRTAGKAASSQRQMDHFTQHKAGHIPFRIASSEPSDLFSEPVEGEPGLFVSLGDVKHYTKNCVRLEDKEAIGRRLKEINELWQAADKLVEAATDIMRDENGAPEEEARNVVDSEQKRSGSEASARNAGRSALKNAVGEMAGDLNPLLEEQGEEA